MGLPTTFTKSLTAAAATAVAASQSPGSGAILINGTLASGGVATLDTARRVIITSGGNDLGITFTVSGTNGAGNPISQTITGTNGGAAQTDLDFKTVTGITHTGSVASTLTSGTNGVGSSHWYLLDAFESPINFSFSVELVSGAANFTVQHTYMDPNNLPSGVAFPLPLNNSVVNAATATAEGVYALPIVGVRLLINSGTGVLRFSGIQSGVSGP